MGVSENGMLYIPMGSKGEEQWVAVSVWMGQWPPTHLAVQLGSHILISTALGQRSATCEVWLLADAPTWDQAHRLRPPALSPPCHSPFLNAEAGGLNSASMTGLCERQAMLYAIPQLHWHGTGEPLQRRQALWDAHPPAANTWCNPENGSQRLSSMGRTPGVRFSQLEGSTRHTLSLLLPFSGWPLGLQPESNWPWHHCVMHHIFPSLVSRVWALHLQHEGCCDWGVFQ